MDPLGIAEQLSQTRRGSKSLTQKHRYQKHKHGFHGSEPLTEAPAATARLTDSGYLPKSQSRD